MSLQVCHCGWSKVTTYHGLRTHQGMMGCTPKGMGIPQSLQSLNWNNIINPGPPIKIEQPLFSKPHFQSDSNMSLQVCHCGWSKVTTYHGLRTHQGMMGCTPKGMGIPESLQSLNWNNITNPGPPIKIEQPLFSKPHSQSDTSSSDLLTWPKTTGYEPKGSSVREGEGRNKPRIEPLRQDYKPMAAFKQEPLLLPEALRNFQSPEQTVKERTFETPQNFHQVTTKSDKSRRRLDFSTWEPQVNSFLEPPSTPGQEPAMNLREKEKKKRNEKLQMARQERMKVDLQQQKNTRQKRMEEVRSSATDCQGHLDAEWLQIDKVFSNVINLVLDARQTALRPLEDRKKEVEREAERTVQNLQRQVDKLEKDIRELDKNPGFQVSPLTSPDDKETSIDSSLSFGTLRTSTFAMMNQILQELEKLTVVELKRIPTFAVDVKLDPTTAYKSLNVSPDGKEVRDDGQNREVPDSAERFDMFGSVLGLNILVSGRAYWEVEVGNKSGWDLGVTRRGANRKGKLQLNPDKGYWVAVCYESDKYAAMTAPPVRISLKQSPTKVGVFVDYEEGLVSFYDVTTQSHIYSFTECSFGGKISPYFSPHPQNDKNLGPLVICAV